MWVRHKRTKIKITLLEASRVRSYELILFLFFIALWIHIFLSAIWIKRIYRNEIDDIITYIRCESIGELCFLESLCVPHAKLFFQTCIIRVRRVQGTPAELWQNKKYFYTKMMSVVKEVNFCVKKTFFRVLVCFMLDNKSWIMAFIESLRELFYFLYFCAEDFLW